MPLGSCGDLQQKILVICNCQGGISNFIWNTSTPPNDLLLKPKVVILSLSSSSFALDRLDPRHSPLPELRHQWERWKPPRSSRALLSGLLEDDCVTNGRVRFAGTSSILCGVWISAGTSRLLMALWGSQSIGYLRQASPKTFGSSFPTLAYFVQRNT